MNPPYKPRRAALAYMLHVAVQLILAGVVLVVPLCAGAPVALAATR